MTDAEYQNLLADERVRVATAAANIPTAKATQYGAAIGAERMKQGVRSMFGMEEPVVTAHKKQAARQELLNTILGKFTNMSTREDYMKAISELYANGFIEEAGKVATSLNSLPTVTDTTTDDIKEWQYGQNIEDPIKRQQFFDFINPTQAETDPDKIAFNTWLAANPTATGADMAEFIAGDKDLEGSMMALLKKDPEYLKAVADNDPVKQGELILALKKKLTQAGQPDPTTAQVLTFEENVTGIDGVTRKVTVYKQYDHTTKKWNKLSEYQHDIAAQTFITYPEEIDGVTKNVTKRWDPVNGVMVDVATADYWKADAPPSGFEAAIVQSVLNTPGYAQMSAPEKQALMNKARAAYQIPSTPNAQEAAYRDIRQDFIDQAQSAIRSQENVRGAPRLAGMPVEEQNRLLAQGELQGNKAFTEWKTNLSEQIARAGGNTAVGDVLGQYKLWKELSTRSRDSIDKLHNIESMLGLARGVDTSGMPTGTTNAIAWQAATRDFVALMRDSNLSLAEVATVKNAGSLVQKAFNKINEWTSGVPTDIHIEEMEAILREFNKTLTNRYNVDHNSFKEAFEQAGTSPELLQSIIGDPLVIPLTEKNASAAEMLEILKKTPGSVYYEGEG